jgi:hypothetical protein
LADLVSINDKFKLSKCFKGYPFETGDRNMLSVRPPPPGWCFSMEDQWLAARRRVWNVRVGAGRGPLGVIARLIGDRDQAL